jgi:ribose transport system substrate-binding protein
LFAKELKKQLAGVALLLTLVAVCFGLAACGSSGSSSTGSGGSTASEETTSAEGETGESSAQTGEASAATAGVDPTKTYAAGVPTLEELQTKGTEEEAPTSGPKAKSGVSVAFVSCGLESPGCRTPAEEGKSAAAALGWNYKVFDGKLTPQGWSEAIRSAIASKPDVIITLGMSCPEIVEPLKEAKAAGIETISLEGLNCNEKVFGEPNAEPGFTIPMVYNKGAESGEDYFYQWGSQEAQYTIDATQGEGKIILTPLSVSFGETMQEAWEAELAKCSGCEVVETMPWVSSEEVNGFSTKFETALVKNPEANATIFNFDSNAVNAGGAKAIVDAGRAKDMVANCGEAGSEAQELIRNEQGLTACAGAVDLKWLAWAAMDEVNRTMNGQESVPEGVGFRVIDKSNLSPQGKGVESSIDFEKAYEGIWKG